METISINGTGFNCLFCAVSSAGVLHMVLETDLITAANVFSGGGTITYARGKDRVDYVGYSMIVALANEPQGVRVSMRRPYFDEV